MINLFVDKKYKKLIRHAVNCVLLHFSIKKKDVDIEIGFLSIEDIRNLNLTSRGIDKVTDVLSFPAIEGAYYGKNFDIDQIKEEPFVSINPENGALILGEIYICLDIAKEQAALYEHSLERELSFLTVHGVLHLLGFDHVNKEEEKEMILLQKEIMNMIGF